MSIKYIDLINPPEHINQYLTHWTGRNKNDEAAFEILTKIVETLELKFNSNTISFPSAHTAISNMMICFTDTPIKQSAEHCSRYNSFGLSFNKNEFIEYGANPVLYLTDNRSNHQEFLTKIRYDKNREHNLISWIGSVLQPYDSKILASKNSAEFNEREWRIVRVLPFHWLNRAIAAQGSFDEYRFKGAIRREQKGNDINKEDFFLKFDAKTIENIIVPKHYENKGKELIDKVGLKCDLFVINK